MIRLVAGVFPRQDVPIGLLARGDIVADGGGAVLLLHHGVVAGLAGIVIKPVRRSLAHSVGRHLGELPGLALVGRAQVVQELPGGAALQKGAVDGLRLGGGGKGEVHARRYRRIVLCHAVVFQVLPGVIFIVGEDLVLGGVDGFIEAVGILRGQVRPAEILRKARLVGAGAVGRLEIAVQGFVAAGLGGFPEAFEHGVQLVLPFLGEGVALGLGLEDHGHGLAHGGEGLLQKIVLPGLLLAVGLLGKGLGEVHQPVQVVAVGAGEVEIFAPIEVGKLGVVQGKVPRDHHRVVHAASAGGVNSQAGQHQQHRRKYSGRRP